LKTKAKRKVANIRHFPYLGVEIPREELIRKKKRLTGRRCQSGANRPLFVLLWPMLSV
jgi:hypothetical protein